jgi:hypothetical protein
MGILQEITEELNNLFTENPDLVSTLSLNSVASIVADAYGYSQPTYSTASFDAIPLGYDKKLLIENFGSNFKNHQ